MLIETALDGLTDVGSYFRGIDLSKVVAPLTARR
jgi:hypothetical protein